MSVEIRPATDAEMDDFRQVATNALMVAPGLYPPEAIQAIRPDMTLCAFEEGRVATSYATWPLKIRFNGGALPAAGITFVGTRPTSRRKGHLRQIVSKHVELLHEKGGPSVAVLYASQASIYQRYGYGIVSTHHRYTVAPRDLVFAQPMGDDLAPGRLRELADDEADLLKTLYRDFVKSRTGYLHRGDATWKTGVLWQRSPNEQLYKVVYEENGQPLGYVIYSLKGERRPHGEPWQKIEIADLVWLTPQAYRALWRHFSGAGLVFEIRWPCVPQDDPLPHLLLEPRRLNMRASDGLLARVVDLPGAMQQRRYDESGQLTFEVIDALCPWNAGRWQLETADDRVSVAPTSRTPELVISIDTLAMLLFGQISPSEAVSMGRAVRPEGCDLSKWDRIMRTRHKAFCPDFF